jgi:hypothetical protein
MKPKTLYFTINEYTLRKNKPLNPYTSSNFNEKNTYCRKEF